MQVCPEETTPYRLGVDTGETMEEREVVIIVEGAGEQPPEGEGVEFVNLMVEPDVIPAGECAMLFWEVMPPGEWPVLLDGQEVPHAGEQEVCPGNTTIYELLVEAPEGPQERMVTLHIEGEPEPEQPPEPSPASPATPTPPSAPPAGPTSPPPPSGGLSADIRPSDLYADKQPHGTIWVRITNDGPGTLTNNKVEISGWGTAYLRTTAGGASVSYPATDFTLNLAPGQTQTINLGWQVDTSLYKYDLNVLVKVKDFTDPNSSNNGYAESVVPSVPVATATPSGAPPGGGSPGVLTADLAATDLFADKLVQGKVYVRITNHGPDSLTNASVELKCNAHGVPLASQPPYSHVMSPKKITVSLNPGQTKEFDTTILLDTTKYLYYEVTCGISTQAFTDPSVSNNNYSERIPPGKYIGP
jgi:hypothetical protein